MTAVIAWTCKSCAHHVDGLSVEEYMAVGDGHVCKVADIIRRGARYWRSRSQSSAPVADWLEACAGQAEAMADPDDFGICDEPSSVKHALAVARACPWWEEPR